LTLQVFRGAAFYYLSEDDGTDLIVTIEAIEFSVDEEAAPYQGIYNTDIRHETVAHAQEEWVRDDVHTNIVESVWSLLKRSVVGTYHRISIKHLDAYLDELEHGFNNRKNQYLFRDPLLKLLSAEALPYQKLVAAA
jgi:ISXO2-like transposase domain